MSAQPDLRKRPEFENLMRASLDSCVKCTICETQCPVAAVTPLFPGPKYVGPQAERFRLGESVDHTIDYCSSCGTCTLVCPQGVKVAELNNVARAAMKQQHGIPLRDKLITNTMLMGRLMTPVAPIANWALRNRPIRWMMEKMVGVHAKAPMPVADGRSFERWFRKHNRPADVPVTRGKVVFFHGCAGEFFETTTSIRSVEVLEHLGYEVIVPKHGCCGLAQQSNALYDGAKKLVTKLARDLNVPGKDLTIIGASGSCVGMVKHEAKEIMGVKDAELDDVSSRIWDISEFLLDLIDRGEVKLDLKPIEMTVTYHAPCQVKSTAMGTPSKQLLDMIPGLKVYESGATCCGIAGTYGLKKEKFDIAQAVGQTVFNRIKDTNSELAVSDTETCRWQIEKGSGRPTVHPVYLLHQSLGLS